MNNKLINKKLFLIDIDGTIMIEGKLLEYTLDLVDYINNISGKYIFITNNSSTSIKDYILKFNELNITVDESNFITSTTLLIHHIIEKYQQKKFYIIGTDSFKNELKEHKLDIVDVFSEDIFGVIVGFDTELTYSKLYDASKILSKKDCFLATNIDLVCPTDFGFIPDCGSICKIIEISTTKKPFYLGKPNPMIVELSMGISKYSRDEVVVIGDRLYTDIQLGINASVTTCLVLTGETQLDDLETTSIKPNYVFDDIGKILSHLRLNKS